MEIKKGKKYECLEDACGHFAVGKIYTCEKDGYLLGMHQLVSEFKEVVETLTRKEAFHAMIDGAEIQVDGGYVYFDSTSFVFASESGETREPLNTAMNKEAGYVIRQKPDTTITFKSDNKEIKLSMEQYRELRGE